ncbi:YhcN/YlaJ family sporulation lipoprotein [Salinibacillus xinjiangensis]|uniref:YhcN/YlaJ family sporulation lipoprotein n=1 Tax=Salinibacillus xinjiangensis TaxID=1229268 RepID=A0A6G1X780_9BACI|nr:YhcN/YlaJ family sporulation lipoprotein [Salinibacillus xinjiangensis]MRG86861.1 YhcN/YlaJ family sporulation lipoprotein [Salinibacillus xinjiangensis]
MNKVRLIGASLITAVTLVGCQGGNEEGLMNGDNNGLEPVRYNNTTDIAPNRERNDRNDMGPRYNNAENLGVDNGNQDNINGRFNTNDGNNNGATNVRDENNNRGLNGHNNDGLTRNTNDGNNNHNQYDVAEKAADRITDEVNEVDEAYVFAGNENAYVAVTLNENNNNEDLTNDLKQRISRAVKATDEDIDDVFVSANPNFFNQAGDYADQLENGEPMEGLFEEMGDVFNRIFPTNTDR